MTQWEKHLRADIQEDTSQLWSRLRAKAAQPRQAGLVLLAIGFSLIALAGDDALASTAMGWRGEDQLRGSPHDEALLGLGKDDEIWGLPGADALYGGGGDDGLYGGSGRDTLLAGAGDDFVEARDGQRDYVECGFGDDTASVDPQDRVAPGCETLFGSQPSPAKPGP